MAGLRQFILGLLGGVPAETSPQQSKVEAAPNSTQVAHSFRKIETPPANLREEDLIPRYPPYMEGLPAVVPERVCSMQDELAVEITRLCDIEREAQGLVSRTLTHYAAVVHLLPASETDHHAMAGGLYRHGLEVARHSLMVLNKYTPFARDEYAERRRLLEPRMRFAVLTAALCHDIGKPLTDVNVTNDAGDKRWNPLAGSLHDWARSNGVERYFLHWNQGRHKKHEPASVIMIERVAGGEGIAFVNEMGADLLTDIIETVSGEPGPLNIIGKVVKEADKTSTERDKKRSGANGFSTGTGIPVDRYYLDTMRGFIRTKKWEANKPGDRVWVIDRQVYVLWPAGGNDIASALRGNGVRGIPLEPQSIAREMMDRNVIAPRFLKDQRSTEFWSILPDPLKGATAAPLQAIRLSSPELLFEILPPSVEGVVGEIPAATPSASVAPSPSSAPAAHTNMEETPEVITAPDKPSPVPAQAESPAPERKDHSQERTASVHPSISGGSPRLSLASRKATVEELESMGLIGTILTALTEDLNRGRAEGAWVRSNKDLPNAQEVGRRILLKVPDALAAYHPAKSQLRTEAMESGLFERNEEGGLDIEVDNQTWWMLRDDVSKAFHNMTAPFQERVRREKERAQTNEVDKKQPPQPGGGGGSPGLRVAPTAQVKKSIEKTGGVTLSVASRPPITPDPEPTPSPTPTPVPIIESPTTSGTNKDTGAAHTLLDAEYQKLNEAAEASVSVRQLIKTMRDAHRVDLGMGAIKAWINASPLNLAINKDSASNEYLLTPRGKK